MQTIFQNNVFSWESGSAQWLVLSYRIEGEDDKNILDSRQTYLLQGDYIEAGGGGFSVEHYSQQEEDKLKQNWTEIILAFTFTVTVVLIFIL